MQLLPSSSWNIYRDFYFSNFFSRCIDDVLPERIQNYHILIAEHTTNDEGSRNVHPEWTEDFKNKDGQSLEQLIRRLRSKHDSLVIIMPEMLTSQIIQLSQFQFKFNFCNGGTQRQEMINKAVAQHYDLEAVIKIKHVACSNPDVNLTTLSKEEQIKVSKMFQMYTEDGHMDPHPSTTVHTIMAEFILNYFQYSMIKLYKLMSTTPIQNNTPNQRHFIMPATLYKDTKLFESDYEFQCLVEQKKELSDSLQPPETNYTADSVPRIIMPLGRNLHFKFDKHNFRYPDKCRNQGFEIGVYIVLRLCNRRIPSTIRVAAKFEFEEKSNLMQMGPVNFKFPLMVTGFRPVFVQPLVPISDDDSKQLLSTCNKPAMNLSSFDIKIFQPKNSNYELVLNAFIIQFKCCK